VEEPAGTIFISAKPDPIWRRRSEPANKPGNKRKLPESRTPIERADERGREQRVRVGDVEDAVAAGAPGGLLARPWFKQFRRLLLPAPPKHLRPFPAIE
jgi:hypothetical protein